MSAMPTFPFDCTKYTFCYADIFDRSDSSYLSQKRTSFDRLVCNGTGLPRKVYTCVAHSFKVRFLYQIEIGQETRTGKIVSRRLTHSLSHQREFGTGTYTARF